MLCVVLCTWGGRSPLSERHSSISRGGDVRVALSLIPMRRRSLQMRRRSVQMLPGDRSRCAGDWSRCGTTSGLRLRAGPLLPLRLPLLSCKMSGRVKPISTYRAPWISAKASHVAPWLRGPSGPALRLRLFGRPPPAPRPRVLDFEALRGEAHELAHRYRLPHSLCLYMRVTNKSTVNSVHHCVGLIPASK